MGGISVVALMKWIVMQTWNPLFTSKLYKIKSFIFFLFLIDALMLLHLDHWNLIQDNTWFQGKPFILNNCQKV